MMFVDEVRLLLDSRLAHIVMIILAAMLTQDIIRFSTNRIVERVVKGHKYSSKTEEHKREQTLKQVFTTASAIVIWVVAIIGILVILRLDFKGLIASAGLISVVAGLSFQSIIKDYLAGLIIIMENQFRVDDVITVVTPFAFSVTGTVEDITIRRTRLRDLNGNVHIINNGGIAVLTNQTFQYSNIDIDLIVPYGADIGLVEKLINKAGSRTAEDERFKENIIEPIHFLRVQSLNESNVTVKAFGKVRPGSQYDINGDFLRRLKSRLVKHNIIEVSTDISVSEANESAEEAKPKK